MRKLDRKLLVIGWDGADWKMINPLIDQGLMPNLEKLVNAGTIGNLATLDPPFSPMLWTSMATGKRPYTHGVMGFNEPDADGVNIRPVLSLSRKCKAIWNILTQEKKKTHTVAWWPSHPAEPINGVAISNFYQRAMKNTAKHWPIAPQSVHPKQMEEHYAKLRIHPSELTGAHLFPFLPMLDKLGPSHMKEVQQLRHLLAENSSLHAAFTNIIRTQEWDFATVYFDGIDRCCHEFMKYHPPKRDHIPQDKFDIYKDIVKGMYQYHDMMLGRVMDIAGDDATIMLISDHGFQSDHLRPKNIPIEPAGIAYEHSQYGIIAIKGPGIKKDSLVQGASILDITPTILQLFDLPIGQDMDGNPLLSIFENPDIPKSIETWETVEGESGMPSSQYQEDPNFAEKMLDQLADLGYIDKPDKDKTIAFKSTKNFCDSNLARAYMDGGKIPEAIEIFVRLYQEHQKPWISYRLAVCYQMIGQHQKCRALIQQLQDGGFYDNPIMETIEASLLMSEGKFLEASKLLENIETKVDHTYGGLYLKIARCYAMIKQPVKAQKAIEKELANNYDNPYAHQFLGIIHLNHNRFKEAYECFMEAISLEYGMSEAHYYLGKTLIALGEYQAASNALEVSLSINPHNNHARLILQRVYQTHLDKAEKADQIFQDFNSYCSGEITIVSGMPRSGTSLMMQLLEATGVDIFSDGERVSDDNNPKGYYEHEVVKKINHNPHWLKSCNGKAVKIVAPLITSLPYNYRYKVIFMERDPMEIYKSQEQMLLRLGKTNKKQIFSQGIFQQIEQTIKSSKAWLDNHPCVDVLYVSYNDLIERPQDYADKLTRFLDKQIDLSIIQKTIDPTLYRERSVSAMESS